jgi:hypothetical protein
MADRIDAARRGLPQRGRSRRIRLAGARLSRTRLGRLPGALVDRERFVVVRPERLHDPAAAGGLHGVRPGQVTDLREIDGDADSLLTAPDLTVLVVEE